MTATFFLLCHRPSFLLLVVNSEQQHLTLLSIKKKRKMKGQQQQKGFTGVQRHAGRTGFSHRRLNRRFSERRLNRGRNGVPTAGKPNRRSNRRFYRRFYRHSDLPPVRTPVYGGVLRCVIIRGLKSLGLFERWGWCFAFCFSLVLEPWIEICQNSNQN